MLTEYYKTILIRARALDYEAPTETALEELQQKAASLKECDNNLKLITRTTPEGVSLHQIGGVRSVKVGEMPLGEGRFARAYLHVDGLVSDDKPHHYVVKVFSFDGQFQIMPGAVQKEIAVLKKLGRYIRDGWRYSKYDRVNNRYLKTKYYVVQTYIPEKTLRTAITELGSAQPLKLEQALLIMLKLTEALRAFHGTGYRHGDIKPDNIRVKDFLSADPKLSLIDFNHSLLPDETEFSSDVICLGQYVQIPPECCHTKNISYTPASDVYALGDVFMQLLETSAYFLDATELCAKLAHGMRCDAPKHRPSTQQLIRALTELRNDLPRRTKLIEAERNLSKHICVSLVTTKQPVIQILRAYTGSFNNSLRGLGSYFGVTSNVYDQKNNIFMNLMIDLNHCNTQAEFDETLKKGLIDYLRKVVIHDLAHYCALPDLGAGIKCFTESIKLCGSEFNQKNLIKELTHVLSPCCQYRDVFIDKFIAQIQLTSGRRLLYV